MTTLNAQMLLEGTTPNWVICEGCVFGDTRCVARSDWTFRDETDDRNIRLIASAPRLARRVIELEDENGALREIISRCASSLNSGAFISPEATVDFMWHLPKEIELRIAALNGEQTA